MSKREDILYTALHLFNEHGYQAVGVDAIRDSANVSKMTLYKHFKNKDMLIAEVLKLRHFQFKDSLEEAIALVPDAPLKLREVFNWHARWFFSVDFFGCMFIRATGEYHDSSELLAISQEHKQWVARILEDIFQEMGVDNAASVARFFQVTLDGMIVNASIFHTFDSINDVWRELCRYIDLPYEALDKPNSELNL